jgi:hypothetical protein
MGGGINDYNHPAKALYSGLTLAPLPRLSLVSADKCFLVNLVLFGQPRSAIQLSRLLCVLAIAVAVGGTNGNNILDGLNIRRCEVQL